LLFLENAKNAQMGNAARESSAKRHAEARAQLRLRGRGSLSIGKLADAANRVLKPVKDLLGIALGHRWY
jgi:hypothetical protein